MYVRERYLSHRVLDDYEAVLETTCRAWRMLLMEKGRLATLSLSIPPCVRNSLNGYNETCARVAFPGLDGGV